MKNILVLLITVLAFGSSSAQCLVWNNCKATEPVCDESDNNPNLWNESYWLDAGNATQDLGDAPVSSNITVQDTCNGATLSVRYLLFLDLDQDGNWETVVKSWEPPAPGTVNYNNANNPNYNGGDVRVFDERPVAANEKYQFALESIANGDSIQSYLRWNTPLLPGTFVNPELPHGSHKIQWIMEDNLGNDATCETILFVKDCQGPVEVCINGLSANLTSTGELTLGVTDFLLYATDNATPSNLLQFSLRKSGTGAEFPLDGSGAPIPNLTFDCSGLGTQLVQLWARDAEGNADFCETYVIIQDNSGVCPGNGNNNVVPTVVCYNGLTVNIMQTGSVQLWAPDFLYYAEDDNTPANLLEFGIRQCGLGAGFPVDGNGDPIQKADFNCAELGTQCVELWARDLDGNADYCETYVIIQDNFGACGQGSGQLDVNPPTVVCLNGFSTNLNATGHAEIFTLDFLQYTQDDSTPSNQIELSIRKCGAGGPGPGFPVDGNGDPIQKLDFDCDEIGTQCVELWARDLDGNADYCETYIIIQDNGFNCAGNGVEITTCVTSACNGSPITNTGISTNFNQSNFDLGPIDQNGCAIFPIHTGIGETINITPQKGNFPLNGVNVFDLIKLKRIILGLETDLSPFTLIAADANRSGTITGFDMIELRKLILGVTDQFPNNDSWRFIDASYNFPNPQNPFQFPLPESINIANTSLPTYQLHFNAIKVGDLDCNAQPGLDGPSEDRTAPQRFLSLPDLALSTGESTEITLRMTEAGNWTGLQMGLEFDPEQLELLEVVAGELPGLEENAFYQPKPGVLNLVWMADQAQSLTTDQDLLRLRVRAKAAVRTSNIFKAGAGFENIGSLEAEPQILGLEFRQNLDAILPIETLILNPQPNPTSAGASIPIQLAQLENVRLELSDLSGKILWLKEQVMEAGSHVLQIAPELMPQTGIYVWRVSAGSKTASGKLIRI